MRMIDADAYDYPGDLKWEETVVPAEAQRKVYASDAVTPTDTPTDTPTVQAERSET